jgi:UDPglucose 6-dehydrogenase
MRSMRSFGKQRPDADFSVASNPDFRREGSAMKDCKDPYRIVVGAVDECARKVILADYRTHFSAGRRCGSPSAARWS